ncbi:hypothetical protein K4L06_15745 [Lysobacter sp. BMK333-48F3]|uniref:hypothetical protein n=1 Tax=Lysobacter sp. BMK333-48F3 TaxID=2867962 RepID=UPI001C8CE2E2|nr:hypothetical protein [Lysobacter sp. BMK333-48F3]MBX9402763.1 hypothetical protein [Lysobacter sp. BMK333-48F3]
MFKRVIALAAFACLPLQAVAAKPETLPMPIAQQLPVELVLNQEEMAVVVPDTSAATAQFGLIGALIGSAIENAAVKAGEKRVAEIRNLLLDYRFNQRIEDELREKLASDGISPNPAVEVRKTAWDAASAVDNATLPADVLVLVPTYAMANNFESMTVKLHATMAHRERKPNGKVKVRNRYARTYAFNYPLIKVSGNNADQDAQRWVAMGSAGLAGLLDRGVEQVTDMLAYDFSSEGRAEGLAKVKAEKLSINGTAVAGRKLRSDKDWLWVRSGNGWMQAINGYQPLSAAPIAAAEAPAPAAAPALPAAPADTAPAPQAGAQGRP